MASKNAPAAHLKNRSFYAVARKNKASSINLLN